MEYLLFYLFSSLALISGFFVVWSRNPVHSVLYLVLAFFNGSGLLLLLEVEFIALIFLVVYVGAIAVLFLFVVMMLAPKMQDDVPLFKASALKKYLPTASLLAVVFLGEIYLVVKGDFKGLEHSELVTVPSYYSWLSIYDGVGSAASNLETLGQVLYTYYAYYFLLAGFILLVSMIGAIALTLQVETNWGTGKQSISKRQHVFEQLSRDSRKAIFSVKRVSNL